MASKELIEKVARKIAKSRGRDPEECVFGSGSSIHGFTCHQKAWEREVVAAKAAISTIRAALQEPTEGMIVAGCDQYDFGDQITQGEILAKEWRAMLAASALGEQSDGN